MNEIIAVFAKGGVIGVILSLLSIFLCYLFFKNVIYLYWVSRKFDHNCDGQDDKINKNPLQAVIQSAIRARVPCGPDLKNELAYLFHRHFVGVERDIALLRLGAVISPLLGLMGTALGMVKVFQAIATHTTVNPAILAGGIWEALVTTIMGLAIGIPAMCFYYVLSLHMQHLRIVAVEHSCRAVSRASRLRVVDEDTKEAANGVCCTVSSLSENHDEAEK